MLRKLAIVLCLFCAAPAWAQIGKISTQAGPDSSIQRGKQVIAGKLNTGIISNDIVSTRKGTTLNINFKDNTKVKITENSRLVIDDFVYDPKKSDAGRLAMKVSMGTVRYASGQIAKVNPQRINIRTPSAAIAVRGTDFHMTVDELGRSLVILVPSCRDENETIKTDEERLLNCQTGKIIVENAAGSVELNDAFSATYVDSFNSLPNPPVTLKLTSIDPRISFDSEVTNDLIISPPEVIQEQIAKMSKENEFEENEEEIVTRMANADRNTADKNDERLIAISAGSGGSGTCSDKIICIEANPYVTFYRTTESDHYAEVRARLSSNLSLTIVHNGDEGKLGWGAAPNSGNTVTIRQSK
jgi:hypothetical protein